MVYLGSGWHGSPAKLNTLSREHPLRHARIDALGNGPTAHVEDGPSVHRWCRLGRWCGCRKSGARHKQRVYVRNVARAIVQGWVWVSRTAGGGVWGGGHGEILSGHCPPTNCGGRMYGVGRSGALGSRRRHSTHSLCPALLVTRTPAICPRGRFVIRPSQRAMS